MQHTNSLMSGGKCLTTFRLQVDATLSERSTINLVAEDEDERVPLMQQAAATSHVKVGRHPYSNSASMAQLVSHHLGDIHRITQKSAWCLVQASTAEARSGDDYDDQSSFQPWYKSRKMLLVLGAYGSIAFLMNFLEELTPIFASAPYDKVHCSTSTTCTAAFVSANLQVPLLLNIIYWHHSCAMDAHCLCWLLCPGWAELHA